MRVNKAVVKLFDITENEGHYDFHFDRNLFLHFLEASDDNSLLELAKCEHWCRQQITHIYNTTKDRASVSLCLEVYSSSMYAEYSFNVDLDRNFHYSSTIH